MAERILEVKHLKKYFGNIKKKPLKAVDDVSFYINKGETFGLVGESGCGKTTIGRTIMKIYEETEGEIIFNGTDISGIKGSALMDYSKEVKMIFQDPYSSINPRMKIKDIVAEGYDIHEKLSDQEREKRVLDLLLQVDMNEGHMNRFPHEFSGGQRQRIGIARALANKPKLLVCDEPVSALDVSIQAKVINILVNLQQKHDLTYLFISHDLSVVRYISDRVGVMYFGKLVEVGPTESLFEKPLHAYTRKLLSAIPKANPRDEKVAYDPDKIMASIKLPEGYLIDDRPPSEDKSNSELIEIEAGHFVACYPAPSV
jgi:oligopeptide/dipeptide ABC transporter ATP-binding protein